MNYTVQEQEAFSVIGQEVELKDSQSKNLQISKLFWQTFNTNLKKAYLTQKGNWVKYAFMEKREGKLFYFCAIPKKAVVPEGFVQKEVTAHRYVVVEHSGPMDDIYRTYTEIYKKLLPGEHYRTIQTEFLHFEKYDSRFQWNKVTSVSNIWIPIQR